MNVLFAKANAAKIPRNYVSNLEAQVDALTRELNELRTTAHLHDSHGTNEDVDPVLVGPEVSPHTLQGSEGSPSVRPNPSQRRHSLDHLEDIVNSVRDVVVEPSRQPRFLGQSSGITLARLVMEAIRIDAVPSLLLPGPQAYGPSSQSMLAAAESTLPPRQITCRLIDVYFQYRTPHLPIIGRLQVEEAAEATYSSLTGGGQGSELDKDIFTTYMIIAIALCDSVSPSNDRLRQSEGCFRSAIALAGQVIECSRSDVESLRAVLLLAQYVSLSPSSGSLWHLTGIALRLCIDIGLHWETEAQIKATDPDVTQDRRRLWWSTYQLDRLLCLTLGRPVGIIDESTRVELPDPTIIPGQDKSDADVHNLRAHNHLFRLAKLESEIKHVQHSRSWTPSLAYPRPEYSVWFRDIQPRLKSWYKAIPPPADADSHSIFASQAYWDTAYYNALVLLHRPTSATAHPSAADLQLSFNASCSLVASIKTLQREGKIVVLWKAVHNIFIAGLGVIYGLWQSEEIRRGSPMHRNISTLQSCASTLSAMSETFTGAAGCRDIFEALSTATVDWLITNNASMDRNDLEQQIKEMLQQIQSSDSGHDAYNLPTMFSIDDFGVGDMLSSLAQWPNVHEAELSYAFAGDLAGSIDF